MVRCQHSILIDTGCISYFLFASIAALYVLMSLAGSAIADSGKSAGTATLSRDSEYAQLQRLADELQLFGWHKLPGLETDRVPDGPRRPGYREGESGSGSISLQRHEKPLHSAVTNPAPALLDTVFTGNAVVSELPQSKRISVKANKPTGSSVTRPPQVVGIKAPNSILGSFIKPGSHPKHPVSAPSIQSLSNDRGSRTSLFSLIDSNQDEK